MCVSGWRASARGWWRVGDDWVESECEGGVCEWVESECVVEGG